MAEVVNIVAGFLFSVLVSMAVVGGIVLAMGTAVFGGCCWWLRNRARRAARLNP